MPNRSILICLLAALMVVISSDGCHARAQEPFFPELVFLPRDKQANTIIDDMASVHLRAMKEPSLWKLSQQDPVDEPEELDLERWSGSWAQWRGLALHVVLGPPFGHLDGLDFII